MDYEVLLVSRIHEEWTHGAEPRAEAAYGFSVTIERHVVGWAEMLA